LLNFGEKEKPESIDFQVFASFSYMTSGAGGIRTRVQTGDKRAFYMLIRLLIVGNCRENRHPKQLRIFCFSLWQRSLPQPPRNCCHLLIEPEPGLSIREMSRSNTLCRN